ncbi:MAG TPA: cytosine permease, partial [Acidimicrobiales bacterium]|nr:cytosine permease [Acidimicrobiales bacterium]
MPAVEERGLEPVPAEQRTGTWRGIFALNVAFFLNPLMYVIGALAVTAGGLPFWWAVAALGIGQLVAFLGLTTIAELGCDHGLPG